MRSQYRGLICILTPGDIVIPQRCLDAFDFCQIQNDFYATLNNLQRIPDLFISFEGLPLIGAEELKKLPIFMRSKWMPPYPNMNDFMSEIECLKERFECGTTHDEFVITDRSETTQQVGPKVFQISPQRFWAMQHYDKPFNQMSHFWIDMSILAPCNDGQSFISKYLPEIRKYKPLAAMYHDVSFQPMSTRELSEINAKRKASLVHIQKKNIVFSLNETKKKMIGIYSQWRSETR